MKNNASILTSIIEFNIYLMLLREYIEIFTVMDQGESCCPWKDQLTVELSAEELENWCGG
jgi:hypothetical protein